MLKYYPKNDLPMITLPASYTWLNKEIRNNLFGGLAAVFCRHAEIKNNGSFPSIVYETPNGSRIQIIQQLGLIIYYCLFFSKFNLRCELSLLNSNEATVTGRFWRFL